MKPRTAPLVSIILINWNNYFLTHQCITSIHKNTQYPNYELFLVDNGSTDGSLEKLLNDFSFAKVVRNKTNKGFSYAVNQGYRDAKGYYLAHINNDAIVFPGWLTEGIAVLESAPNIAIAGVREISKEEAADPVALDQIRNAPNLEKMTLPVGWVTKKSVVEKVGYLDAEFFSPIYGEEADWNFRARKMGYTIIRVSKMLVRHFSSVDTKKGMGKKRYDILINYHRLRSMLFNLSFIELLRFVPGLGLILVNSFWQGIYPEIFKSYWLNICDWKLIREQRKKGRGYIPFKEPTFTIIN
jgi:GT2 family glycosyltransferase